VLVRFTDSSNSSRATLPDPNAEHGIAEPAPVALGVHAAVRGVREIAISEDADAPDQAADLMRDGPPRNEYAALALAATRGIHDDLVTPRRATGRLDLQFDGDTR
jgi:hypothetical protein